MKRGNKRNEKEKNIQRALSWIVQSHLCRSFFFSFFFILGKRVANEMKFHIAKYFLLMIIYYLICLPFFSSSHIARVIRLGTKHLLHTDIDTVMICFVARPFRVFFFFIRSFIGIETLIIGSRFPFKFFFISYSNRSIWLEVIFQWVRNSAYYYYYFVLLGCCYDTIYCFTV